MHLSEPMEYTAPRVSPNVHCGLWVVMMCQWRFINCNKCTLAVWDVNNGGEGGREQGWGRLCTGGDGEYMRTLGGLHSIFLWTEN